jgi:hypothetical protein
MRKTAEGTDIYIDTPNITLAQVLNWLPDDDIPFFQTLGGEDINGSFVQHRTFTRDTTKLRNQICRNAVAPLTIMTTDYTCCTLSAYLLNEPSFKPTNYDFDIENTVRCYSSGKHNVLLQINSSSDEIIAQILEKYPDYRFFFETAEKYPESFLVFEDKKLRVVFPGVSNIDEFKTETVGDTIEMLLLTNE